MSNKTQDKLIFDVGLCKGEDTEFYLKKGFSVVAFEADPKLVDFCKNKFSTEIQNGRLNIVEGAIVDDPSMKTVTFFRNDNPHWGTLSTNWAERNEQYQCENEEIEVNAVNFTKCIEKYGMPYFMKIDIEGADKACLTSILNFSERPRYVSIESSKVSMVEIDKEFEIFRKLGCKKFKAIQQATVHKQIEPNPTCEGSQSLHQIKAGSSGLFGSDLPGIWLSEKQILKKYEKIMLSYDLFLDENLSKLKKGSIKKNVLLLLRLILLKAKRSPVPGWYDTHAKFGD